MTEQQMLQFLQNYAAYTGADTRVVMLEMMAANNATITAQFNALQGTDAQVNTVIEKLLRITDALPGTTEHEEGVNLYTAITQNFSTLDPRITTAQQTADAASAAATALAGQLATLTGAVSALSAEVTGFKTQTALDFSNMDAAWKAGDQAVLATVEANRVAGVAAAALLRTQLDAEDAALRDSDALVAANAAANLVTAKADLRAEIASEKTIASNENTALATQVGQDITAARADAAQALLLAKGNLETQIAESATATAATAAAATSTEAAARVAGDTQNAAAIAAANQSITATNTMLANAFAGQASINMELSRALRGMPSLTGFVYTPPVFNVAWSVADVAASVAYLETSNGDMFGNSVSGYLLGSGFNVAAVTSITSYVAGQGNVTTPVVSGMDPVVLFALGAGAGANPVGLLTLATNGVWSYVRFAGANVASPAPVTFAVAHQDGVQTDTATLTITHLPN